MSVYERVKANYVDPVDDHTLIKGAIDGMLAALDPHSSYVEARRFRPAQDDHRRQLRRPRPHRFDRGRRGQGRSPRPRTRRHGAPGIKSGDYITHINGEFLNGLTLDEAVEKMKGDPGTPVKLTIVRPGRDKPFDVTHRPRADRASPGQVGDQGRRRLHQHQHLHRQRRRADQVGAAVDRQGDRRPPARLCRRPALQPGRAARPGGRRRRRLPRQRRDRFAARPHQGRYRALLCASRRHGARPSGDRADRRRHRFGVGDRRRRAPGPPPRADHGRDELRQGLGPDRRPDRARTARSG